jgi:hypothetical protein
MSKPQYELAEVIRDYGKDFSKKHRPLKQHLSVLSAIQKCRTAALGGHVDECDRKDNTAIIIWQKMKKAVPIGCFGTL